MFWVYNTTSKLAPNSFSRFCSWQSKKIRKRKNKKARNFLNVAINRVYQTVVVRMKYICQKEPDRRDLLLV